jgi:pantetheine-phosphate adenylyltransferase
MRAIFPASFDPITNGHLDVATRASRLFDELVLAVYDKPAKNLLFTLDERVELARASTAHLPNVRVEPFSGLMVEHARRIGAGVVVRGLRSAADFDPEYQQATANYRLAPELEIVLLLSHSRWAFVSSSLIKEIARLGGDVGDFVPPPVAERLRRMQQAAGSRQ